MTTRTATWTDGLGVPYTSITADFDEDAERVYVDAATLRFMSTAIARSGLFDAETTAIITGGLLAIEAEPDGRFDVTDHGGGWAHWLQLVEEEPEPSRRDAAIEALLEQTWDSTWMTRPREECRKVIEDFLTANGG